MRFLIRQIRGPFSKNDENGQKINLLPEILKTINIDLRLLRILKLGIISQTGHYVEIEEDEVLGNQKQFNKFIIGQTGMLEYRTITGNITGLYFLQDEDADTMIDLIVEEKGQGDK